ncbi:MAG: hypothetical protein HYY40_12570 [Bacteroidetes bacterium]|nr:hypothetical protein [Bacteroidota bacterium]
MKKRNTINQKETEKNYLDKFKKLFPNFPLGKIHCLLQHEEPPDLEVGNIGIEVTELHLQNFKKIEEFQNELREDMQIKYDLICSIPLYVAIEFREGLQLKNEEKRGFIEKTAELVSNEVQQKNIKIGEEIKIETHDSRIEFITITYYGKIKKSNWECGMGMLVPNPCLDEIKKIIEKKNNRVGKYKRNYDEKWLLIVETGEPSSIYDDYSDICNYQYESNFDRIFVFQNIHDNYFELKNNKINILEGK